MKLHLLKQIPGFVENWGALWAYSCFWFENLNGMLKKIVHGTRYVSNQVRSFSNFISKVMCTTLCVKSNRILKIASSSINDAGNSEDVSVCRRQPANTGTYIIGLEIWCLSEAGFCCKWEHLSIVCLDVAHQEMKINFQGHMYGTFLDDKSCQCDQPLSSV